MHGWAALRRAVAGLSIAIFMLTAAVSALAAPYCLLRKPFNPPQGNCFQFYPADTAVEPPSTMAVAGAGVCVLTDYALRQGRLADVKAPGPHATAGAGDAAMSVVSPDLSILTEDGTSAHTAS